MPFYDYNCGKCGSFRLLRGMKERDHTVECPNCGTGVRREMAAPNLSLMPAPRRAAFSRNEKSRHEPGVATRHRCSTGCGCSDPRPSGKAAPMSDFGNLGRLQTVSKVKRPWMLGH